MRSDKVRTDETAGSALLAEARSMGVNVSGMSETGLREIVDETRARRWLAENLGALQDANEKLERHGLWSDGQRIV